MPEVHAILSASSSKRWLNCTPSARLEQNFPNESSVYAEEGTAAHALGEYKLRKYLHERVKRPTLNMRMRRWKRTRISMRSSSFPQWSVSRRPVRIRWSWWRSGWITATWFRLALVPGDCVIIADGTLYVMDYKNGKHFLNLPHAYSGYAPSDAHLPSADGHSTQHPRMLLPGSPRRSHP